MTETFEIGMEAGLETAPVDMDLAPLDLSKRRVMVIMGALLLGMFLAALDQTVVSTALPTIVGDLGGASHLSWVVTAYLLSSTVSMPLWGKLGDLYGRKAFFQACIVIFLVGSALSGFSHSMIELIIFRTVQGLGGGGLMVGAQTIVGDVVSPRERGRYMGLFGAMFGVTTVLGPLVGGMFVEYLSWRWVFYINLPFGITALFVTAAALPGTLSRVKRVVDYLGTSLLALAAAALVLFTSLGGVSFGWFSTPMLVLLAVGVIMTALFLFAERRAQEPVIPLKLFRNKVFSVAGAIGFVIGFAMFGALTFLPLFLQVVKGVSPTESGIALFPLMGGLLLASIGSGRLVTRWGKYKVFPIAGTLLMTIGLYLMSLIGAGTGSLIGALYMFVFGVGLGLVMQVLVVAVQNSVTFEDLGVATSGATFFRMIGGSFGAAIFGAVYTNVLASKMAPIIAHSTPDGGRASFNFQSQDPATFALLAHKLPVLYHEVINAIAGSVDTVFFFAAPVALLAFALSWFLPEMELRKTVRSADLGESFAMPQDRTSLDEIRLILEHMISAESRVEIYRTLAKDAGFELSPRASWLLYRFLDHPDSTLSEIAARLKVSPSELEASLTELENASMIERTSESDATEKLGDDNDAKHTKQRSEEQGVIESLTPKGQIAIDLLLKARQDGMTKLLERWEPEQHPDVIKMIKELSESTLGDDEMIFAKVGRNDKD